MARARKPWYDRRIGAWGHAAAVLVCGSIALGFLLPRTGTWLVVEGALLVAGSTCYFVGLLRSPD